MDWQTRGRLDTKRNKTNNETRQWASHRIVLIVQWTHLILSTFITLSPPLGYTSWVPSIRGLPIAVRGGSFWQVLLQRVEASVRESCKGANSRGQLLGQGDLSEWGSPYYHQWRYSLVLSFPKCVGIFLHLALLSHEQLELLLLLVNEADHLLLLFLCKFFLSLPLFLLPTLLFLTLFSLFFLLLLLHLLLHLQEPKHLGSSSFCCLAVVPLVMLISAYVWGYTWITLLTPVQWAYSRESACIFAV